ncbi:DUF2141 domain-containing protein [Bizionia paragorgiae]|uniref:Uncharacterized conserved protein, DUF2141 family n=1 Tax=Bizionia paragorgiae TaxID=283786 RepID=A0A1H4C1B7_BIZPA|nr:DUF2141 domain-containing protein [Bizionia paragorgiae]MDX1271635.1 DUF2141 domain-containing protein [Bizionia paragorgiae]SEA54130.1 Uncharacterized conserved protein, DUF2141 family [Bizionia paragorgiae]
MKHILIFLGLLCFSAQAQSPELTLNITNIETIKGSIEIGVFNTAHNYLKEGAAYKNYTIEVTKDTETIVIKDLPKGEYAISMYHDENSDDKCNKNFIGIPKEAYGFSNNVVPKFSAPSFEDCKFVFNESQAMAIQLRTF